MAKISDMLARMSVPRHLAVTRPASTSGKLHALRGFGTNPGALLAHTHVPETVGDRPPLVVVLHGCTQTAAGYDAGSGWSQLAERHGLVLLFPEQQRQNNANGCFNWFSPVDNRRDKGEALSICQMIAAVVESHGIDQQRIFVTGLSAGGAMAAVMLATYPEVFAGGAIIAGLPYGCADTVSGALDRMRGRGMPGEAELTALVRKASPHAGPWPTLSIWHGSGDATVNPTAASAIVGQWRTLHGLDPAPSRLDNVDGYPRQVWCDASGREVIEEYSVTGMGHGTPLQTDGPDGCGIGGAFMLDVGISSTRHIATFWGLAENANAVGLEPGETCRHLPVLRSTRAERIFTGDAAETSATPPPDAHASTISGSAAGVGKVIEDALRAAGLMR